jgi:hypothetical protein
MRSFKEKEIVINGDQLDKYDIISDILPHDPVGKKISIVVQEIIEVNFVAGFKVGMYVKYRNHRLNKRFQMPSKIKIIRKCEEVYNIQLENGH